MKKLFKSVLIFTIVFSCTDSKKQDLLNNHMQKPDLQNFLSLNKPELDTYVSLLAAKTKSTITTAGFESVFVDDTDSIVDYFLLEFKQDSVDPNHKDLSKAEIIEKIASDIKPRVANYKLFKGISIEWSNLNELSDNVGTGEDVTYKQLFSNIPDVSNFKYQFSEDTLIFQDYYYNGKIAYKGKMFNKMQVGYWEYWYSNGNKKKEGLFIDDKKVGEWKYWNENGEEK